MTAQMVARVDMRELAPETVAALENALANIQGQYAKAIYEAAKSTAGFHDKSGELRTSIYIQHSEKGWVVGASSPNAAHVEFGHALVRKGRVVGHVSARAFLRPAVQKAAAQLGGELGAAAGAELGPVGVAVGQVLGSKYGAEAGGQGYDFLASKVRILE